MPSSNFPKSPLSNPVIESLYFQHFEEQVIAPGNPQFIATEDLITLSTEDGVGLITEG